MHCDFGLMYLGLATDTQENAYVLKVDEVEAPAGIQASHTLGNKLQDILAADNLLMANEMNRKLIYLLKK